MRAKRKSKKDPMPNTIEVELEARVATKATARVTNTIRYLL